MWIQIWNLKIRLLLHNKPLQVVDKTNFFSQLECLQNVIFENIKRINSQKE